MKVCEPNRVIKQHLYPLLGFDRVLLDQPEFVYKMLFVSLYMGREYWSNFRFGGTTYRVSLCEVAMKSNSDKWHHYHRGFNLGGDLL